MKPGNPRSVEKLFNSIAPSYDKLNDLLSLGLHRIWKRQLLILLRPNAGENWIDLCCGTGDLTLALARSVYPGGSVIGIDSAEKPLFLAQQRVKSKTWLDLSWLKRDALNTCLPSHQFDGAVMAYGLRNLSDPYAGLCEIRRLLKPGARAGVLDFNHIEEESCQARFQEIYLRRIVVPIAAKFGLREQYEYLEESLRQFPVGKVQEQFAYDAGFSKASHRLIAGRQMGVLLLKA